jgi:glutaredoxin 3
MEMMERTGRRTVPQIYIGDYHVGGFDDLSAMDRAGKLEPLLRGEAVA